MSWNATDKKTPRTEDESNGQTNSLIKIMKWEVQIPIVLDFSNEKKTESSDVGKLKLCN